jgi:hypothetical protein
VAPGASVTVAVDGFGGMGRPDASSAPDAGAGTTSGRPAVKASDVTITSE